MEKSEPLRPAKPTGRTMFLSGLRIPRRICWRTHGIEAIPGSLRLSLPLGSANISTGLRLVGSTMCTETETFFVPVFRWKWPPKRMINDRLRGGVSYPEGVSGLSPDRLRRLRRARLGLRTHIPERVALGYVIKSETL